MSRLRITINTMYQYDRSIFDSIRLPATDKMTLDKDTFITCLLTECGDLLAVRSDPRLFRTTVHAWAVKNAPVWQHMADTTTYTYDPIENYDRKEEYSDTRKSKRGGNNNATHANDTQTDLKRAGFNTATLTLTDNQTTTDGGTTTTTYTDTVDDTVEHTAWLHGNIGVTTTQQMIEEERRIAEFNFYDYIITDFRQHMCVAIY